MSVIGLKKSLDGGGWVGQALSKFILDFWNFVNFAKPLSSFAVMIQPLKLQQTCG